LACIGRELTKMHETHHRGTLQELVEEFDAKERVKGEIVFMVAGAQDVPTSDEDVEALLLQALQTQKTGDAAAQVAIITGAPARSVSTNVSINETDKSSNPNVATTCGRKSGTATIPADRSP